MRVFVIAAAIALSACAAAPASISWEPDHAHGSAPAPAGRASVMIIGPAGKHVEFAALDLVGLPRATVEADFHGEKHSFEGVPLIELLKRAGAPSGNALRGSELLHVVIVTARDGYQVALSLAEIDPEISPTRVILADKSDGAPIPDTDGPFRLVVEGDVKPARSARMVTAMEVRNFK